ncbi:MAG: DUF4124 domain-containing protein [Wenzhouxiangella sp.]|nr:DUF4124 domain-containing protein [Wenzhouxiangella sp.]
MRTLLLLLALCLLSLPLAAQPIYKVVDEDGNVTYTDQKPSEDAEPMDLPRLNVLDGGSPAAVPMAPASPARDRDGSSQMDFRIVSPEHEEHIFGTGNTLHVRLSSSIDIPSTAQIVIYINGEAQSPVRSLNASFEEIDRGEHTLRAELQTSAGRVLASTDTITFYMRQASRLHPQRP